MTSPGIAIAGPEHAVAAAPHLLGFAPTESLVAVWVRDRHVVLTQRVDLPGPDDDRAHFAALVIGPALASDPDSVVFLCYANRSLRDSLGALVDALLVAADARSIDVLDVLIVDGTHFVSALCGGHCCPPDGQAVSPEATEAMSSAFGHRASDVLPSRTSLVHALGPDPLRQEAVAQHLPSFIDGYETADARSRAIWRDTQLVHLRAALGVRASSDLEICRLLVALSDVRVRDVVMWDLARSGDDVVHLDVLGDALRCAPAGHVAPVGTCFAMLAWFMGDGARAVIALDRVLSESPAYRLALLLQEAMQRGLPPMEWRAALAAMSEDELREPTPIA